MTLLTMPTEAQLARMRAQQESTMRDLCAVERYSGRGNDQAGGRTEGTLTSVNFECRIAPMSLQREEVYAQQLRGRAGVVVTGPWDLEVERQEDIHLPDGRTVEIIGFSGPHTNDTAQRIYCMDMS